MVLLTDIGWADSVHCCLISDDTAVCKGQYFFSSSGVTGCHLSLFSPKSKTAPPVRKKEEETTLFVDVQYIRAGVCSVMHHAQIPSFEPDFFEWHVTKQSRNWQWTNVVFEFSLMIVLPAHSNTHHKQVYIQNPQQSNNPLSVSVRTKNSLLIGRALRSRPARHCHVLWFFGVSGKRRSKQENHSKFDSLWVILTVNGLWHHHSLSGTIWWIRIPQK